MKKRVIIIILWIISLFLAAIIGAAINTQHWKTSLKNRSHSEIEAEFLIDQMAKRAEAGLPSENKGDGISCLIQMWGRPLPPNILTELSTGNNNFMSGISRENKDDTWLQAQL